MKRPRHDFRGANLTIDVLLNLLINEDNGSAWNRLVDVAIRSEFILV